MGYDVHITRAEHWPENAGREIGLDEWLTLVAADPELRPDPDNDDLVLWSGPSQLREPWLGWWEGNVSTKYPDQALMGKMLQLAQVLGANVQGDEGEVYTSIEQWPDMYGDPDFTFRWQHPLLYEISQTFVGRFFEGLRSLASGSRKSSGDRGPRGA